MKKSLLNSIAIFLLPLGVLIIDYGSEFLAVDSCLDSGGSYNYYENSCDHENNHPYSTYLTRKRGLIIIFSSLSVIGLVVFGRLQDNKKQEK